MSCRFFCRVLDCLAILFRHGLRQLVYWIGHVMVSSVLVGF